MGKHLNVFGLILIFVCVSGSMASFTKYPYIQNMRLDSITVMWETAGAATGKVQYGLAAGYGSEKLDNLSLALHGAVLSGLQADTVYHYRVISGTDTSTDAVFRTGSLVKQRFTFLAFGDTRSDSASHRSIINRMVMTVPPPVLAVHSGDLTGSGTAAEYRTFFNTERNLIRNTCLFPVLGNHDVAAMANWNAFFSLPNNERYYTARYRHSGRLVPALYHLGNAIGLVPGTFGGTFLLPGRCSSGLGLCAGHPAQWHGIRFLLLPVGPG
jgi:hypothetical protein